MKLGFIGCGKLGLPCAEVMAEHYEVEGYDVKPFETKAFKAVSSIKELVAGKDFVFISVPTPHHKDYDGSGPTSHLTPKDFGYATVVDVVKDAVPHMEEGSTLVLISTVLPGTIREKIQPLLNGVALIYNPYLIAMSSVKNDMRDPEMIIMGTENGSLDGKVKQLMEVYSSFAIKELRLEGGTWEEAEAIKIFYNTFISFKVGFANMILDVSERMGNMNVDVVTQALGRSDKRLISTAYLTAGIGDGGPCHPRDNIALRYLAKKLDLGYDLFDAIMQSREQQANNLAKKALSYADHVVILGQTYKPGTCLTDGSYALLTGHYVQQNGGKLSYHDPEMGLNTIISDPDAVYLISHHHDWMKDYPFPDGCTVIDLWRKYENEKVNVVYYGAPDHVASAVAQ